MESNFERVVDAFKAAYPHWNLQIAREVTAKLTIYFKWQRTKDPDFLVKLTSKLWEHTEAYRQRHDLVPEAIKPAFVINAARSYREFAALEIMEPHGVEVLDWERLNFFEGQLSRLAIFQQSYSVVADFFKRLNSLITLTPREHSFFKVLEDVAISEGLASQEIDNDSFWAEVKLRIMEDPSLMVTEVNFRRIKSRLVEKLEAIETHARDFLHFSQWDRAVLTEFALVLSKYSEEFNELVNTTAYRLSAAEWTGVSHVIQLCNEVFEIERIPEIYYMDFKAAKSAFGFSLADVVEGSIDFLGVYVFSAGNIESESEEGQIILFKDRIKAYAENKSDVQIDDLRYVVLMHELGHWVSHWPKVNGSHWRYGYQLDNKRTKEALANLIAYWCLFTSGQRYCFNTLVPTLGQANAEEQSKCFSLDGLHKVDTNNPYGAYCLLKGKPWNEICSKIVALRAFFWLSDEVMMDFLISEERGLIDFLKKKDVVDLMHAELIPLVRTSPELMMCIINASSHLLSGEGLKSPLRSLVEAGELMDAEGLLRNKGESGASIISRFE